MQRCAGRAASERGFTLMELIVVIILLGILAAVAMPRLQAALGARGDAYRDSLVAGLRLASATAQGHRRLVCASVDGSGQLALRIAAANPASSCSNDLPGPDGQAVWARPPSGVALTASPASTLYFQPGGAVSSTASGSSTDFSLRPTGMTAITVRGSHGLVE